jgi:signal transduction histidine kinase
VERPTILIISEQPEFVRAISTRWRQERNGPALLFNDVQHGSFDLAIVGFDQISESLRRTGAPIIHVSQVGTKSAAVISIPEFDGWPDLVITVSKQIFGYQALASEFASLSETKSQLEGEAVLGRYILEMRHNLNNAITSILGNSELMLMDGQTIPQGVRLQVETIRNMGMRMNEILQRFTSLQKEMQLAEQQKTRKRPKGAAAGI